MSDESDDDVGSSLVESMGEESSSGGIHNWPVVMAIGAIIGLLLLLLTSVGLLFLEHKAITTAASLEQGVANVQTVSAEKVDPANNDKVVHLTGEATTNDTVTDKDFGIGVKALRLARVVEVYQWKEKKSESKKDKKKITTYTYTQVWSKEKPSHKFEEPKGHTNPEDKPYADSTLNADNVKVGAFTLAPRQLEHIPAKEPFPLTAAMLAKLPADLKGKATVDEEGRLFVGNNVAAPKIGDARISYTVAKPQKVSLIAKQSQSTFEPYVPEAGEKVDLLKPGEHTAAALFESSQSSSQAVFWLLRIVCFGLIWGGLFLIFRRNLALAAGPGGILREIGVAFFAALLALDFVLVVSGSRQIIANPLLGLFLLVVGSIGLAGVILIGRRVKPGLFGGTTKWSPQEREAFRRVALEPDNPDLRLELAALLEKKGNAMGEFIRINEEMEDLDEDSSRYAKLDERWSDLLANNVPLWFLPLRRLNLEPQVLGSFYGPLWMNNGVIDTVTIDIAGVLPEKADQLFNAVPGLRVLEFHNIRTVQGIGGWKDTTYKPKVSAIVRVPHLKQIGVLKMSSLSLTVDDLEAIASSPNLVNLVDLDFSYNSVGPEGAAVLAQSTTLTRLRCLELRSCDLGTEGAIALMASPNLGKLVTLNLGANALGRKGAAALAGTATLKKLEELYLDDNDLGPVGAQAVVGSPHLRKLTLLDLNNNDIGSEGAMALAQSANLAALTSLELNYNKLGGEGLISLAGSPHLGKLEILEIESNEITPEGAKALAESTIILGLEELSLSYNQIGNPGAVVLAGWPGLARLKELKLRDNKIGAVGIKVLAASPHLKRLKELDLSNNDVGLAGAQALADSPFLKNLEYLWLQEANLTPAGEKLLRKRFEDALHIE